MADLLSLPTRERGLKFICIPVQPIGQLVAPYTGAWIEIEFCTTLIAEDNVAPYTGAWIEMLLKDNGYLPLIEVAPYTGAWIEIAVFTGIDKNNNVAPYTGAWIEIRTCHICQGVTSGRSLHGSVD